MKDKIYLYDGEYVSLLNLVYKLFSEKIVPLNIKTLDYECNLFQEAVYLDINKDEKIIDEIINIFGLCIFNTLYKIYLSNNENKEIIIYHFMYYASIYKNKVYYMRNIKAVSLALKIEKYVSNETHKMKGFLRFKELSGGALYGEMEPTNNILPLLINHFKERLSNQIWIIKDVKRNMYGVYDSKKVYIVSGENVEFKLNDYSNSQMEMEELWVTFYKTIGIKNRKNDRCRMNFMPKKYWKYLIEVSDQI